MKTEKSDYVTLGLVLTWPVFLCLGVGLYLVGSSLAFLFLAYCLTSSLGIAKLVMMFIQYGFPPK